MSALAPNLPQQVVELRIQRDKLFSHKINLPQVTLRATVAGLAIGSVVLISNFQFGLQTGWVSMMSLPSALLGFTIFKLSPLSDDFLDVENVFVQSVAVAVGTGPLTYGLIGIVPAIEKFLKPEETGLGRLIQFLMNDLLLWCLGLGLFGVFFAIPLREQVIIKEKLPFPSGSATATLISVLHGSELYEDIDSVKSLVVKNAISRDMENYLHDTDPQNQSRDTESSTIGSSDSVTTYSSNIGILVRTFTVSALYTLLSYFIPILKKLPIFGNHLSEDYMWNFQPSPAYIGQGIIMGLPTVLYMLFGAVLGWAVLAPLAKHLGWAPGDIDDWVHGGQGWILWLSLSVMITDAIISFAVVIVRSITQGLQFWKRSKSLEEEALLDQIVNEDNEFEHIGDDHLVGLKTMVFGVILSSILCVVSIKLVFADLVPVYALLVAIFLALIFSVLAVRALGETDLNPVSGIGKMSQLLFAVVIPNDNPSKILINLIAGGIAEAGAQQAGDLMQDLKTGHLVGASPKAQFLAQIIGTAYSVFLSSIMYKVYNSVYTIPSDTFRIPTAVIWVDCLRLVTGGGLPPHAMTFSIIFAVVFGMISLLKNTLSKSSRFHKYLVYLPSGVAVGIGIYNSPNFTLARFLGGVIAWWWLRNRGKTDKDNKIGMIIFSSGLVLGEGLLSGVTMLLTSLGVPHF